MSNEQRRRRAQRANALCRPTAAGSTAVVDTPPGSGAKRYPISWTDPDTGETLIGYARCSKPPTAETREALATLMMLARAAVLDGTLPDGSY